MTDRPEPKDPAEVLRKHFTTLQAPGTQKSRYVMSERNRLLLERIHQKVRQLRGQ